jgi:hypothetical protein
MKVLGLDGKTYSWNLAQYTSNNRNVSSLHSKARALLQQMYPMDAILEEVALPGTRLFADFYINRIKMIVEVHGEQHYKYNAHFFNSQKDFLQAKKRDQDKKNWAKLNGISLVELPFNEQNKWESIINERH